jgi:uncharacterized repeat protein (TIGR01451 family)
LLLGALLLGPHLALAQGPGFGPPPYPVPALRASPLLYVRFTGPPGMEASFFQGGGPGRRFPAPVVVGMRPGYRYRVGLGGLPGRPGLVLFPTVEVLGTLNLTPKLSPPAFPAVVHLTEVDLEAVAVGTLVTKVVYLEDPDRAEPVATRPGEVIENDVPRDGDILGEARARGRLMLVVHFGERTPTREEVAAANVPGTLLLPGQRSTGPAAAPPIFPFLTPKFYDPFLGPRRTEEECLHDGGDRGPPAALDGQGRLGGLDPEDTVAEFTDSRGRRGLTCSNRVCLCVPRFVVLRKECPLARSETVIAPVGTRKVVREGLYAAVTPSGSALQVDRLKAYQGRLRPGVNVNAQVPGLLIGVKVLNAQRFEAGPVEIVGRKEFKLLSLARQAEVLEQVQLARVLSVSTTVAGVLQVEGTGVVTGMKAGPQVVSAAANTRDLTQCCNEPLPPDKPLCLVKCADKTAAQVGEVVTFTLRYSNDGGRAITDVAVTDSLSGRLEYVEGSAASDRDAVFTVQANEAGSVVLRWEIAGRLLPGSGGKLRFQARVR